MIIGKSRYVLLETIFYYSPVDNSFRIVLPKSDHLAVFKEAHQGKFAGYLRDAKIHSQLIYGQIYTKILWADAENVKYVHHNK